MRQPGKGFSGKGVAGLAGLGLALMWLGATGGSSDPAEVQPQADSPSSPRLQAEPRKREAEQRPLSARVAMAEDTEGEPESAGQQDAPNQASGEKEEKASSPQDPRSSAGRSVAQGDIPELVARLALPFRVYRNAVEAAGGRLAIFDREAGRLRAFVQGERFASPQHLERFANRTRDVTADLPGPLRDALSEKVRQQYGPGAYRFLLLFPHAQEKRFVNRIRDHLADHGLRWQQVDRVTLRYVAEQAKVYGEVESVVVDGQARNLGTRLSLWAGP